MRLEVRNSRTRIRENDIGASKEPKAAGNVSLRSWMGKMACGFGCADQFINELKQDPGIRIQDLALGS
jgi:hypothetical protein